MGKPSPTSPGERPGRLRLPPAPQECCCPADGPDRGPPKYCRSHGSCWARSSSTVARRALRAGRSPVCWTSSTCRISWSGAACRLRAGAQADSRRAAAADHRLRRAVDAGRGSRTTRRPSIALVAALRALALPWTPRHEARHARRHQTTLRSCCRSVGQARDFALHALAAWDLEGRPMTPPVRLGAGYQRPHAQHMLRPGLPPHDQRGGHHRPHPDPRPLTTAPAPTPHQRRHLRPRSAHRRHAL